MVIKIAGWLVGEQKKWVGDEGAGENDTLLLAAGEFAGEVGLAVEESYLGEPGAGFLRRRGGGGAADEEGHHDVFEGGELGEEGLDLPDEADVAVAEIGEVAVREGGEVGAVEEDPAGGGAVEAAEEVEEGGFAGTGGADKCDTFAAADGEVEITEDGDGSAGGLIGFFQTFDADDGIGWGRFHQEMKLLSP